MVKCVWGDPWLSVGNGLLGREAGFQEGPAGQGQAWTEGVGRVGFQLRITQSNPPPSLQGPGGR